MLTTKEITGYYKRKERDILDGKVGEVYLTTWEALFTPIEQKVWEGIRYEGLLFYPQYPVLNYRLDFANPIKKIAIEADGAQYHEARRYRLKDQERDKQLKKLGWDIIRIKGSECYRNLPYTEFTDESDIFLEATEDALEYYYNHTSDGIIKAIKYQYWSDKIHIHEEVQQQALLKHSNVKLRFVKEYLWTS